MKLPRKNKIKIRIQNGRLKAKTLSDGRSFIFIAHAKPGNLILTMGGGNAYQCTDLIVDRYKSVKLLQKNKIQIRIQNGRPKAKTLSDGCFFIFVIKIPIFLQVFSSALNKRQ
ncbi:MAG: hypothetical protein LKE53_07065 [Oscillospiraceae bacterium]|nr:hypothetical protein [Oscillospiraceae bacterium]MDD3261366.1 hypothetical protein [Oscillospiraceae bacterium]